MMEAFKLRAFKLANHYRDRGFSPIPILAGKKQPGYAGKYGEQVPMSKWQQYCDRPMTLQEMGRIALADPWAGIGLCMGYGDVVAVDVDDARAYPVTREILGGLCAPVKRGAKGGTAFYRGPGLKTKRFTAKDGQRLVEVLAHGTQTIVPGTIHPVTGEPYRWIKGNLEDVTSPLRLPVLTQAHVDQIAEALAQLMPEKTDIRISISESRAKNSARLTDLQRKRFEGYAWKALEAECADLAAKARPGRNDAVFRVGCLMGRWVHNGIIKPSDLQSRIREACERNGLVKDNGLKDVMNTLGDGLSRARNDGLPELAERARP
jgi:hypothetical protein